MSQRKPTPEERERIVKAALDKVEKKLRPEEPNDLDRLNERLKQVTFQVRDAVKQIVETEITNGHIHTEEGRNALFQLLYLCYRDKLVHFTQDELVHACALVHAGVMLDTVA